MLHLRWPFWHAFVMSIENLKWILIIYLFIFLHLNPYNNQWSPQRNEPLTIPAYVWHNGCPWGILHFVWAVLGTVCRVLKKRGQCFENVCKQLEYTVTLLFFNQSRKTRHKHRGNAHFKAVCASEVCSSLVKCLN